MIGYWILYFWVLEKDELCLLSPLLILVSFWFAKTQISFLLSPIQVLKCVFSLQPCPFLPFYMGSSFKSLCFLSIIFFFPVLFILVVFFPPPTETNPFSVIVIRFQVRLQHAILVGVNLSQLFVYIFCSR